MLAEAILERVVDGMGATMQTRVTKRAAGIRPTESPRFPGPGSSPQGQPGPKARPKGVADGSPGQHSWAPRGQRRRDAEGRVRRLLEQPVQAGRAGASETPPQHGLIRDGVPRVRPGGRGLHQAAEKSA